MWSTGDGTYMAPTPPVHLTIGTHPTPTATFGRVRYWKGTLAKNKNLHPVH